MVLLYSFSVDDLTQFMDFDTGCDDLPELPVDAITTIVPSETVTVTEVHEEKKESREARRMARRIEKNRVKKSCPPPAETCRCYCKLQHELLQQEVLNAKEKFNYMVVKRKFLEAQMKRWSDEQ